MPILIRALGAEAGVAAGGRKVAVGRIAEAGISAPPGGNLSRGSNLSRGLLRSCANPGCGSGWLHLWRDRSAPVFEGGWSCSPACTSVLVASAVRREMEDRSAAPPAYRHRIPIGLVMLEQGWITQEQLRGALEAQKTAGAGRLGRWLVRSQGVSEKLVARALALQWNCPVLSPEFEGAEFLTPLIPRLFLDAFGVLPMRVAAGKILYLGFEDRLDPVLALAIERMTGLRVEWAVVEESFFRRAHARMLDARFPPVELVEAAGEQALIRTLARTVERLRPAEARLTRVHDCLWLRLWLHQPSGPVPDADAVRDVIASMAP
jgi:hypothetical protein